MMKTVKYISTMLLAMASLAMAQTTMPTPENPATGIWIQQVGDIVPHASTKATLYYTKYEQNDRVKSISYQYNGAGYLLMKPSDRKTLCTKEDFYEADGQRYYLKGADGIVHHPDGSLLVAGQGPYVHKVRKDGKETGKGCMEKTAGIKPNARGIWHLMMDPTGDWLWGADIPGALYRFSTKDDPKKSNFADTGYVVHLRHDNSDRDKTNKLSTIIWDGEGRAFFTYSEAAGGGCEKYNYSTRNYESCNQAEKDKARSKAYFGVFTDTSWATVNSSNIGRLGGSIGDRVIDTLKMKILIDSLEGAHGGAYDPYSKSIFVFGGARIVQIKPRIKGGEVTAEEVASIDLRKYFFLETVENMPEPRTPQVGWRLDQGTTDGYGHIFVAANTGHMVFVDFAANPDKLINDNVLVHVQYIDKYLDDLAPLSGVGVIREGGHTGHDTEISSDSYSSSMVEYVESSSSAKSSSSLASSSSFNEKSSSSGNTEFGSSSSGNGDNPGSSSSGNGGDNPGSSSSGNGDNPGSSSSGEGGDNPGSSSSGEGGDNPGSSSSGEGGDNPGSSSSGEGGDNPGSSSSGEGGDNPGSSSSGEGDDSGSSSSRGSGSGEDIEDNSSSSRYGGSGEDIEDKSSSSRRYYGADDFDIDDGSGYDDYPTVESFEKGDSIVAKTVVLEPTDLDSSNPNVVVINGNKYLLVNDPSGIPMDLRFNSGLDSAKVGDVVAITLNKKKVKEYFGSPDSLTVVSKTAVQLVDPSTGEKTDQLVINPDGSVTIFVTSDRVVDGGSIKVYGGNQMVVIDNINFYDPIPNSRVGYIKDTDGDMEFDYVEILLTDTLSSNYYLDDVKLVVGEKTLTCVNPKLNTARDRILVDVRDLVLPGVGEFPKDAKALIYYSDKTGSGASYVRESSLIEMGSNVIKDAFAIRNTKGLDSLFLLFNIDLMPVDVTSPDMLVMLKQEAKRYGINDVSKVYMPAKDIVILVGKDFKLRGNDRDSVSLYPNVSFENLQYITSDEYDREIRVKVMDRLPSAKNVEYWDDDGDGVLDRIVTVFDRKLTSADIDETLYMSYPWYSFLGMMVQLQAQPSSLTIDPADSTRVIWNVTYPTRLATGVTSISEKLPQATVYTYYSIFGETFVSEEPVPLVDRMPPIVTSATLDYGKKADTLLVTFSEPILTKDLNGSDYFSYIHGKDTIELKPTRIDWSNDGLTAKLVFDGSKGTIMPGDSLLIHRGAVDAIKDNYGNVAGENPQAVIIGGLLNHLVESTNMGSFDIDDGTKDEEGYTLQTVSSVNLRYVKSSTTKEDLERDGKLGQLVQLGERFVPQLLDGAQVSADGSFDPSVLDSLKPEDVYISFIVNYFDHLGQYVNDTTITVPCNSPKFGGNCLETDKKVFVNWNFKDHKGRFVGTGIYSVQFKMIVRYKNKKIEEEIKDKWGVRRKKMKK